MRMALSTGTRTVGTVYFVALLREELGRRIQQARRDAGLTQQQLADAIGLQYAQSISNYERGISQVDDFRIDQIAEATGQPRSYFVRDPGEPDPDDLGELKAQMEVLQAQLAELLRRSGGLQDTQPPVVPRQQHQGGA